MNQSEQKAVGSIDPYAHTSSNQVNSESTPLRVASDNPDGPAHHAPLDPSSTPKTTTTTTTTTATPVATATTAATPGRKPSLTDTLIAGAATAATTATKAATNAVEAARRLVGNNVSSEIDLDNEAHDTIPIEKTSSSKGGILNLMKSPFTNNGLEFSQRKLSVKKKSHSSSRPVTSTTAAAASSAPTTTHSTMHDATQHPPLNAVPNTTSTPTHTAPNNIAQHPMQDDISNNISSHTTMQNSSTQQPLQSSMQPPMQNSTQHSTEQQHPIEQTVSTSVDAQTTAPARTNITFSQTLPIANRNNNGTNTTATSTAAGAPTTNSDLPRGASIVGQTAVLGELHEPHDTLYVVHQGGAPSQALGVDKPTVSSTNKTIKTQTQSGLGVDKPLYVGVIEDPKTQARRRGSLHVDKTPVFSQDALNDPNDKEQNSYTGEVIEPNSVAGNEKPAPLQSSFSRRRQSSFSSMNVDAPTVATSKIAGSGSTDNTNRNRPVGTYNTGINVDRPGHHNQKSSGFGVDKPAIVTHQLATANKMNDPSPTVPGLNTETTIINNSNHSPPLNNLGNPQNSTTQPYSTTTTSETVINPAEIGPTVTYQNPPNLSTSAPVDPLVIPANYDGPIPQVNPGEQVIWVKKTVQTDYYDGANDNSGSLVPPAPTQDSGTQKRRSSSGSLLDRILGRRTSVVSMDKGKQRT